MCFCISTYENAESRLLLDPPATVAELADAQDLGTGNGDLKMPRKPRQDRHFTYRLIFGGSRFGPVLNALRHQQSSSRYESSLSHLELGPLGEQAGGG
jgi:hypothetical protein